MKPISLPLIPFLLVFVLGVHTAYQTDPLYLGINGLLCLIVLGYFSLFPPFKKQTFILGLCFYGVGYLVGNIDQKLPLDHYSQLVKTSQENSFTVVLERKLKPTKTRERFNVKIEKVNDFPATGSLLLTVNKSEGQKKLLNHENKWIVKGKISPIQAPLNPGSFNYKAYLQSIKIYHELNISIDAISVAESTGFSFRKLSAFLLKKLEQSRLKPETIVILKTILLGERNSLDNSTRDDFAKAGVVHLFAISGLHIGLLMLFFQAIFYPFRRLPRGRLWQNIGVLACLWAYAFLVGGTASVIRAVTLFSAYQIGQNSGRKLPTAYLVLLSMGILLFFEPSFIQQLGFQMSYLAVFGILFLSPLFAINIKNKALRWFWQLTIVSLSAQIAVAPLSIFHFNQFPTLFLLSNWVILPFMGLFLYASLIVLLWLLFFPLPQWLLWLEDTAVETMLNFVQWVAEKENLLLNHLYFDPLSLILIYLALICITLYGHSRKIHWFYGTIISLIGLYLHIKSTPTQQLWVAQQYKQTVLVEVANKKLTFHFSDSLSPQANLVKDYRRLYPHQKIDFQPLANAYHINGASLLIIDGPWVLTLDSIPQDYWILQKNAKVNLERLLQKAKPRKIIIDGSNSPYYRDQWVETLKKYHFPYHITSTAVPLFN